MGFLVQCQQLSFTKDQHNRDVDVGDPLSDHVKLLAAKTELVDVTT